MNQPVLDVNNIRVPSLPTGIAHLMEILANDEISFAELTRELERYATICARLISLANSAWAATSAPITTVEGACKHLGFNVVKSTSIALAVSSPFSPSKCPAFSCDRFWQDALSTAEIATILAEQVESSLDTCSQTVRTAGLLHNLGLLLLVDSLPEATGRALQAVQADPTRSLHKELSYHCGIDYCQAAQTLFGSWGFPSELTDIIVHQNDEEYRGNLWKASQLLMLSKQVVGSLREPPEDINQLRFIEVDGISQGKVLSLRLKMAPRVQQLEKLAGLLFS